MKKIFALSIILVGLIYVYITDKSSVCYRDKSGRNIDIVDNNNDGVADMTLARAPFGSVPGGLCSKGTPTAEQQTYFKNHR
jgi:hypothetical protein